MILLFLAKYYRGKLQQKVYLRFTSHDIWFYMSELYLVISKTACQ